MPSESPVAQRWRLIRNLLNERQRRAFAAAEAKALGPGGVSQVVAATGLARNTVLTGLEELAEPPAPGTSARRRGGGRKPAAHKDPALLPQLLALIEPHTAGEPPLRWTCKSLRALSDELRVRGHPISHVAVRRWLLAEGYRLQPHADPAGEPARRDAQFAGIAARVTATLAAGEPVIAVEAKRKERTGEVVRGAAAEENAQSLEASGERFGTGWVDAGIDADCAGFAAQTVRRWWLSMGRLRFPNACELLIVADAGPGRSEPWLLQLGRLARDSGLAIHVSHIPVGTHKWSRIEHRLSGAVTLSWPERAPVCHQALVQLIAAIPESGAAPPRGREREALDDPFNYSVRADTGLAPVSGSAPSRRK